MAKVPIKVHLDQSLKPPRPLRGHKSSLKIAKTRWRCAHIGIRTLTKSKARARPVAGASLNHPRNSVPTLTPAHRDCARHPWPHLQQWRQRGWDAAVQCIRGCEYERILSAQKYLRPLRGRKEVHLENAQKPPRPLHVRGRKAKTCDLDPSLRSVITLLFVLVF